MSGSSASSVRNLGPLTTVWAAPSACTDAYVQGTHNFGWVAQTCATSSDSYFAADNLNCWPPRSGPARSYTNVPLGAFGYYSPGLACPSGYTTACSQTAGGNSNFNFNFPPSASETAYGFCPTGYFCTVYGSQTCITVATSTAFPTVHCQEGGITSGIIQAPLTILQTSTMTSDIAVPMLGVSVDSGVFSYYTTTLSTVKSAVTISAPLIQLIVKKSDILESSRSTPTITGSNATAHTITSSNPPTSISTDPAPVTRLNVGVIAGITIGALAGVVFLVFAGFCCFKARTRKRTFAQPDAVEKAELHSQGVVLHNIVSPGQQLYHEAPADESVQYSPVYLHEAPSSGMHWEGYDTPQNSGPRHELQ